MPTREQSSRKRAKILCRLSQRMPRRASERASERGSETRWREVDRKSLVRNWAYHLATGELAHTAVRRDEYQVPVDPSSSYRGACLRPSGPSFRQEAHTGSTQHTIRKHGRRDRTCDAVRTSSHDVHAILTSRRRRAAESWTRRRRFWRPAPCRRENARNT